MTAKPLAAKGELKPIERGDVKRDHYGIFKCMAVADGYVMCRRPGRSPLVKSVKEWNALDDVSG